MAGQLSPGVLGLQLPEFPTQHSVSLENSGAIIPPFPEDDQLKKINLV